MSWDPGPYFHHCLHPQFTFSLYFQLPLLLSLALILCKQQGRRNWQLLCTRWEQSYLLCVQVQVKEAIFVLKMVPLFPCHLLVDPCSPTGQYSTLASSLRATCCCATSNLPLGVTNEESYHSLYE